MKPRKPYLDEVKCSWWCGRPIAIYMFSIRNERHPDRVIAEIRPYCDTCATYLITARNEHHKPFKRDILTSLVHMKLTPDHTDSPF